jgi:putative acetyltransferase
LKRFFVASDFRRKGIAQQILNSLETKAKKLNFKSIKLETGAKQYEAVNFYKKHGYVEIDRFGFYIDCELSLCFEKQLIGTHS